MDCLTFDVMCYQFVRTRYRILLLSFDILITSYLPFGVGLDMCLLLFLPILVGLSAMVLRLISGEIDGSMSLFFKSLMSWLIA